MKWVQFLQFYSIFYTYIFHFSLIWFFFIVCLSFYCQNLKIKMQLWLPDLSPFSSNICLFFRDNFPIDCVTCLSSSTTLGFIFSFFLLFLCMIFFLSFHKTIITLRICPQWSLHRLMNESSQNFTIFWSHIQCTV